MINNDFCNVYHKPGIVSDNGIDAARYFITRWSFEVIGNGGYSVDTFFFLSGLLGAFLGLKEMRSRNGKINVLAMYGYRYLRYGRFGSDRNGISQMAPVLRYN